MYNSFLKFNLRQNFEMRARFVFIFLFFGLETTLGLSTSCCPTKVICFFCTVIQGFHYSGGKFHLKMEFTWTFLNSLSKAIGIPEQLRTKRKPEFLQFTFVNFDWGTFLKIRSSILPWGQTSSYTKFYPDRFSRFDVYWIQKDRQTNRQM